MWMTFAQSMGGLTAQAAAGLAELQPLVPNRPEDVLKADADEDGVGGDDTADALRYLVATKARGQCEEAGEGGESGRALQTKRAPLSIASYGLPCLRL